MVLKIAEKNINKLGIIPVLNVFENLKDDETCYNFLFDVLDQNEVNDIQVISKYVEYCLKTSNFDDALQIVKNKTDLCDVLKIKKMLFSRNWDNMTN